MSSIEEPSTQKGQLSQTKQKLLQKWKRGELAATPDAQSIIPRHATHGEALPLSFAQQRLWFIDQLVPGSPVYNVSSAMRLTGTLNIAAFQKSLNDIVRRHEVLRASFPTVDGKATQRIRPTLELALPIVDLAHLPVPEREAMVRDLAYEEARRVFDLAQGPLIRVKLYRLSDDTHIFLLLMHHSICDGWSIGIFLSELKVLYEAYLIGNVSALPELPLQFTDYVFWQRAWMQGEVLNTQLTYWKTQLADANPILSLPVDHPRPEVQTFRGHSLDFTLSETLSKALKALGQSEGCSLFMTLLAAFQVLLYRYSGQDDIIVGTPIANRQHVETEGLIGFFANTLALRTHVDDPCTFRSLLSRVRKTTLGALAHQDLPFEYLVDELHLERNMSHNPLFQVMFNFGNAPSPEISLPGLKIGFASLHAETAMFDLWLAMWENNEQLGGALEYTTDLFEEETARRLLRHFQTLLESIVAQPESLISQLPLYTTTERQQLLTGWNATTVPYPLDGSLHQLIEEQVARTPDAIGLDFEGTQLTYAALNSQANQLAHSLRGVGVGPDVPVGVCMERSLELVIGLLAILKAGGAYVPLDPEYPQERLAFLLADTRVPVILIQQHLVERLPEQHVAGTHILYLAAMQQQPHEQEAEANLNESVQSTQLAYIIYTSGSTGRPKGVMNTHRGIRNRLLWMQDRYKLDATDRVLQKTPYSFDVSVWEFFWPLLAGARLVIAPPEVHRDSAALAALIAEQKITTLHFVPSMLNVFLEEPELARCRSLRQVMCSGEALSFESQQRFFTHCKADLHNLYGPTEAAVDVTSWQCERESTLPIVPIGKPIANIQMYILDQHLQPVPVGVTGALHIGGVGLARGYLQRPELTAEKFIPHPFSTVPGERLYHTGDLARYLPDGAIAFLGRSDDQVKLRGFRIELGEIETTLRQSPLVQEALVLLREDTPGEGQLVSYIVPRKEDQIPQTRVEETPLPAEQVEHWQQVFNDVYQEAPSGQEPTLNIVGWTSSYTGLPIPTAEMREWVERTADRILSLHPQRALEIGCGTGLILFRVAPYCTEYIGTDFSPRGLASIQQQLTRQGHELPQVQLLQRPAHDFSEIEDASFDTIILNSVLQYFPGVAYLLDILKGAFRLLKPGGSLFLGDIRSLPLLETFHTSVELQQAPDDLPLALLSQRVQQRVSQETELVIDPGFFHALQAHFPQIGNVEIHLKRGLFHNEMVRFRYDVILTLTSDGSSLPEESSDLHMSGQQQTPQIADLRQLLMRDEPALLIIDDVPNARLTADIRALELLTNQESYPELTTAEDVRKTVQEQLTDVLQADPEDFSEGFNDLPYGISLHWSGQETAGNYRIVLRHHDTRPQPLSLPLAEHIQAKLADQTLQALANDPLQNQLLSRRIAALRTHLKVHLPEYMIPTTFLFLEAMPLTANGKIDRRALPAPDRTVLPGGTFIAPRTPMEKTLAGIWKDVIGLERIGIHDNFFELGGDSIRSIQIVTRAAQIGLQLKPRLFFQHQTIAELAKAAEELQLTAEKQPEQSTSTPEQQPERQSVLAIPSHSLLTATEQAQLGRLVNVHDELEDAYPLVPMQHQMLLQRSLTHNDELYWLCMISNMKKAHIDMQAFEQAWQLVVNRQPTMRTTFITGGLDEPLQAVQKEATFKLEQYDWRGLSPVEQQQQAEQHLQALRQRGSNLAHVPHLHLAFARISDEDYYMLRGFNYMLQDGWSSTLLNRDFVAFYEALCRNQEPHLDPPYLYREHIDWLQHQDIHAAETFWRKTLAGLSLPTTSPFSQIRQRMPSPPETQHQPFPQAGEPFTKEILSLSIATTTGLQSLARKHQLTLATLLNSAWALLVSSYSERDDITFGMLSSGRPPALVGSEYTVGFFNNILPLRVQLSPETRLSVWLRDIQTRMVELREYEYTPILKIKEWLGLSAPTSLFESYVVFENFPRYSYDAVGGKARQDFGNQSSDARTAFVPTEYPLRIEFWPFQQLVMMVSGYQRYCSPAMAEHLLQQIRFVLEQMLTNPTQSLQELLYLIKRSTSRQVE